jgi:hypothetical protein
MFKNHFFHLYWIDILAAGLDEFLFRLAAHVPEEPVLVKAPKVSGVVPPFPEGVFRQIFLKTQGHLKMLDVKGCFMTKEWEKYIPIVASAHEMMKSPQSFATKARELEKGADGVVRKPHKKDGVIVGKTKLIAKFD